MFVLLAALAVVFWHFYTLMERRIADILSASTAESEHRFALPDDLKNVYPIVIPPAEMDVTGAWAAEQARRGVNISDEEIAEQRAMWAQEGVN